MKNIIVFFGGQSIESDISVITGVLTANSIDKTKYNVIPIYIAIDGGWYTGDLLDLDEYKNLNMKKLTRVTTLAGDNGLYQVKGKKLIKLCAVNLALNCLHGERGEDGSIAGLLNMCKIPLASPNMCASSIAIDKTLTKIALKGLGVEVLDSVTVESAQEVDSLLLPFDFPVIVKPITGGSSIGITVAKNKKELFRGVNFALKYSEKAIIEPCLDNFIEINCAGYLNDKNLIITSPCEKPIGATDVLTFSDKYKTGKREFPAKIDKKTSGKIQDITKLIYKSLGFSGIIRIDFFVQGEKVLVNEINSVPGSLAYYLFCKTTAEFSALLQEIFSQTEIAYAKASSVSRVYKSNILISAGGKSVKRL